MDNFYKTCMPLMSDGRNFTDYRSDTRRNEYIKYINSIDNNDNYRMFLQKNTKSITDNEFEQYKLQSKCIKSQCVHNYPTRMMPQNFVQERMKYNRTFTSNGVYNTIGCEKFDDYRLSN